MSFQAMTWAVSQKCGSAAAKMVLLMLANHTNGHTGRCNPRHKMLAEECEMSVETLRGHLVRLEERGLIKIEPQFLEGVQLPNQYKLMLESQGGGGGNSQGGGVDFSQGGGGKNSYPYNQEVKPGSKPPPKPPEGQSAQEPPQGFATFWEEWPSSTRKGAKQKCLEVWLRKGYEAQSETIVKHVASLKTKEDWLKNDGAYIPAPLVYLNQCRWDGAEDSGPADDPFAGAI